MNLLYPMIRRVRRPLWPVAETGLVAPAGQSEKSAVLLDATGQGPAAGMGVDEPASVIRADVRRSKLKEKAE